MDWIKQIEYWKNNAISDFESAEILIEKKQNNAWIIFLSSYD